MRSLTRVTVTDNDKNTSEDLRNTCTKAIVRSKMKDRGLYNVQSYFTYIKTSDSAHKFDQKWSGILFFSPTGVPSFCMENDIENSAAFCIGKTTSSEAKKHSSNIFEAEKTTIESVLEKAISTLNKTKNDVSIET